MRFGSACSGIDAASFAWKSLGWTPVWFSEIADFPCKVLKARYLDVPNLGDMTKVKDDPIFQETDIDILVGGTPCQSFSLGGERLGLDDPRGQLALEFLRLVQIKRPRWVVWENVSGVLSSAGGPDTPSDLEKQPTDSDQECKGAETYDFYAFQSILQELGYGFAARVLDAQFFGVGIPGDGDRRFRAIVIAIPG